MTLPELTPEPVLESVRYDLVPLPLSALQRFAVQLNRQAYGMIVLVQEVFSARGMHQWCR